MTHAPSFPRCAARYVPLCAAGWFLAMALTPRGALSFGEQLADGVNLMLFVAAVSMFLLLLLGVLKRYGTPGGFRTAAVFLLLMPVLPLALGGGGALFGIMLLTQVVFATAVMPKPELPAV
ncbi:hypothetical protein ACFWBX_11245 [Streptomyces sp. NPDC059991]|uniref:hypothetical protein n=1 Tax=Streptomyces sp. NPDC059991 TaxID=3347028 RepID=UPI0036A3A72B